jgi:hypothetical protein
MLVVLGYTNDFSISLQKRDQDIFNAMALVGLAKDKMEISWMGRFSCKGDIILVLLIKLFKSSAIGLMW